MADTRKQATPADAAELERQRAEDRAESAAEAEANRADETIPGGRYITSDGRTVNANGEEITDDGKVKK